MWEFGDFDFHEKIERVRGGAIGPHIRILKRVVRLNAGQRRAEAQRDPPHSVGALGCLRRCGGGRAFATLTRGRGRRGCCTRATRFQYLHAIEAACASPHNNIESRFSATDFGRRPVCRECERGWERRRESMAENPESESASSYVCTRLKAHGVHRFFTVAGDFIKVMQLKTRSMMGFITACRTGTTRTWRTCSMDPTRHGAGPACHRILAAEVCIAPRTRPPGLGRSHQVLPLGRRRERPADGVWASPRGPSLTVRLLGCYEKRLSATDRHAHRRPCPLNNYSF